MVEYSRAMEGERNRGVNRRKSARERERERKRAREREKEGEIKR